MSGQLVSICFSAVLVTGAVVFGELAVGGAFSDSATGCCECGRESSVLCASDLCGDCGDVGIGTVCGGGVVVRGWLADGAAFCSSVVSGICDG